MKPHFLLAVLAVLWPISLSSQDIEGSKDHPMFNRMAGFIITDYSYEEFGAQEFYDENENNILVEGEKTFIYYESEEPVAPLKVIRNYGNAAKEIGGKTVEYTGNTVYINIRKESKETWAVVNAGDSYYSLTIVEKADVRQEITANDILKQLNSTGKAILYINFDSGKSTIKEDSKPIIGQIIQLLENNPNINLSIEGHTDSQGDNASNLTLSENRAKTVMNDIVDGGISSTRLSSKGFGEEKPLADNADEAGRAKNRRVELIKKP